jgi:hypothetical protein
VRSDGTKEEEDPVIEQRLSFFKLLQPHKTEVKTTERKSGKRAPQDEQRERLERKDAPFGRSLGASLSRFMSWLYICIRNCH